MLPAALPTISGGGVAGVAQGEGAYRPGRPSPACEICDYADVHGSWPPTHRGTHCADTREGRAQVLLEGCHRSWSSRSQSHCPYCHRHFGSNTAGDAHRVRGECRDPEGFDRWDTPNGPIFGGRDPETSRAAIQHARITPRGRPETHETPSPLTRGWEGHESCSVDENGEWT